jgi:hypothetical protein
VIEGVIEGIGGIGEIEMVASEVVMTEGPEEISVIDLKAVSTAKSKVISQRIAQNVISHFISARKPREFNNNNGGDRKPYQRNDKSRSRSNDRKPRRKRSDS